MAAMQMVPIPAPKNTLDRPSIQRRRKPAPRRNRTPPAIKARDGKGLMPRT
jgi:hypothetical protein